MDCTICVAKTKALISFGVFSYRGSYEPHQGKTVCFAKAKTSCAETTGMPSHDTAHVIYATKALGSLVCMFV